MPPKRTTSSKTSSTSKNSPKSSKPSVKKESSKSSKTASKKAPSKHSTVKSPEKSPIKKELKTPKKEPGVSGKTKRVAPTRDSVVEEFDAIIAANEQEIQRMRDEKVKHKGAKFLRSQNKQLKVLRAHTLRLTKQKSRKASSGTTRNSGFLKPVVLSDDLVKFTGWDQNDSHSRVDVTKFICDYISKKELQNPENRREIIPDAKLQKLLNYDPKNQTRPLTYASLQTFLKEGNHFPKTE